MYKRIQHMCHKTCKSSWCIAQTKSHHQHFQYTWSTTTSNTRKSQNPLLSLKLTPRETYISIASWDWSCLTMVNPPDHRISLQRFWPSMIISQIKQIIMMAILYKWHFCNPWHRLRHGTRTVRYIIATLELIEIFWYFYLHAILSVSVTHDA